MSNSLFLSHPLLLKHGLETHSECPERLERILSLAKQILGESAISLDFSREITHQELRRAHTDKYIRSIESLSGLSTDLDFETPLTPHSVQVAKLAAGLGIELVERVVQGKIQRGFALIRPPGHHAEADGGLGYCIFNTIALAARHALFLGVKKILILDWDVHHGNGTQNIFYSDDRVLVIDIHQENLFPVHSGLASETGQGRGLGSHFNIPLPEGCTDQDYLAVFDELIIPRIDQFKPELILISAGFDAHAGDPHGNMLLSTDGFRELALKTLQLAQAHSLGRVIGFLEGGYGIEELAQDVLSQLKVFSETTNLESKRAHPSNPLHPKLPKLISHLKKVHLSD